ncbi:hypothetical protein [Priestia megaterium]|uniref:hypothetical protein n=1 Tax=Priestia megaterium TaxID=1404 RepID=UPI0012B7F9FE|nr:hypothetical protein [Priestia megaterium]
MFFISKIFYQWHRIRLAFLELLLEGCMDKGLENKLNRKINYHKHKIEKLSKDGL